MSVLAQLSVWTIHLAAAVHAMLASSERSRRFRSRLDAGVKDSASGIWTVSFTREGYSAVDPFVRRRHKLIPSKYLFAQTNDGLAMSILATYDIF